jgi:excisionase family DNA binding protein
MKSKPAPTVNARLLTIKDASTYLSVHIWFLRTCAWERKIPFLKLGNRLLFDIRDLDAFVAAQKQGVQ